MPTSPTALSLALLRRSGYVADVCERWIPIPGKKIRKDLFGCFDVLAIDQREPAILAVQCTSVGHVADRLAKAKSKPALKAWLRAGGRMEVWGWAKRGDRWEVKRVEVRGEDLADVVVSAPRRRRGRNPKQPDLFD
jgi:hypothetical protein